MQSRPLLRDLLIYLSLLYCTRSASQCLEAASCKQKPYMASCSNKNFGLGS